MTKCNPKLHNLTHQFYNQHPYCYFDCTHFVIRLRFSNFDNLNELPSLQDDTISSGFKNVGSEIKWFEIKHRTMTNLNSILPTLRMIPTVFKSIFLRNLLIKKSTKILSLSRKIHFVVVN